MELLPCDYFMMTEIEYVEKVKGFLKKSWKDKEATMYVAFCVHKGNGGEGEFVDFFPPMGYKPPPLPTESELDKIFAECQ
jgi:hypothetical protein